MIINESNIRMLGANLNQSFSKAFGAAPTLRDTLATIITSATSRTDYAWVGQFPQLREWVGERVVKNIAAYTYSIENRKFESTFSVPADAIADDVYGIYGGFAQELGRLAAEHPDTLIFELIRAGFSQKCFDGSPFFGNHKVSKECDVSGSVSNAQIAATAADEKPLWLLLDTTRALKPFIWQEREKYKFQAVNTAADTNVFMTDNYFYGARGRGNAGYGFWQQAFASQLELTPENFGKLRQSMVTQKRDDGSQLGVKPNILLVGESNREAAFYIAQAATLANQQPNPNYNLIEVIVTPNL